MLAGYTAASHCKLSLGVQIDSDMKSGQACSRGSKQVGRWRVVITTISAQLRNPATAVHDCASEWGPPKS